LRVDGMHCASCERLIEHAALRTRGVLAARASYATGTARIVHDSALIAESGLPTLLSVIGYPARLRGERAPEYDERPDLLRMLTGACLAGAVMMLSFLFVYPLHAGLAEPRDYEAIAWLAFDLTPIALAALTSVVVFYVGWPILRDALTGLRVGMPNMDTLLALAILAAWGYSACQLFLDPLDLYFDVAGSIVAVVTIGRFLERGVRADTLRQLHRVLDAPVPTARVRRDGVGLQCAANEVVPGDRVFVRPGETIPVDGTIVDGIGAVDESLLTGEPFPLARGPGERVLGGAVLREGSLEIDAGAIVQSRIASLASVLWDAQSALGRGPAWVDRMTRVFVPSVLFLAVLVGLARHAGGAAFEQALLASLATLIVACPCTLGLAIPLTTAAATGAALRRGILVTRADLFDRPARIDLVAFDKTGTLSTGVMEVVDVVAHEGADVLTLAAAVERASSHPVAQAIARLDRSRTAREVEIHAGRGACGSVGNRRVAVGSRALFERLGWLVPEAVEQRLAQLARGDSVVSYVGWDGIAHGAILTRDRPRPGWERVIERLRERGPVVMLTGAEHPNGYAGAFDEVFAGVPPEAKAAAVRRLQMRGRVAMVGDGSNDAAALAQADLGIAFGAPTALAAQGAALVVTGDRLERVLDAFALLAATRRRIRQNLGWALGYNAVALPLAMAGLINPLLAALAMAASSIVVVLNAARPLLRDPGAGSEDSARPRERAWAA
jgi:Cu2+-exporting ATPase